MTCRQASHCPKSSATEADMTTMEKLQAFSVERTLPVFYDHSPVLRRRRHFLALRQLHARVAIPQVPANDAHAGEAPQVREAHGDEVTLSETRVRIHVHFVNAVIIRLNAIVVFVVVVVVSFWRSSKNRRGRRPTRCWRRRPLLLGFTIFHRTTFCRLFRPRRGPIFRRRRG